MPNPSKSKKTKSTARTRAAATGLPAAAAAPPGPPWDREASDLDLLGHCAANVEERRRTLEDAVMDLWAAEDITQIRRVESDGRCLWVMWRRTSLPPA